MNTTISDGINMHNQFWLGPIWWPPCSSLNNTSFYYYSTSKRVQVKTSHKYPTPNTKPRGAWILLKSLGVGLEYPQHQEKKHGSRFGVTMHKSYNSTKLSIP